MPSGFTWEFCSTSGNGHFYEWKPTFSRQNLFLLVETDFLAGGNHFLPLSQIFFKNSLTRISENVFYSPKKKVLFLSRAFFHASENRYLNYGETYLKLFHGNHFLWFFRYSWQFSLYQKRLRKRILHSREWKLIFCLVETVFF